MGTVNSSYLGSETLQKEIVSREFIPAAVLIILNGRVSG